jgi:hypothetical protein
MAARIWKWIMLANIENMEAKQARPKTQTQNHLLKHKYKSANPIMVRNTLSEEYIHSP